MVIDNYEWVSVKSLHNALSGWTSKITLTGKDVLLTFKGQFENDQEK